MNNLNQKCQKYIPRICILGNTYDCALALPETSLPKFSSERDKVTIDPHQKVLKHAAALLPPV
jgi:hypothetical protein